MRSLELSPRVIYAILTLVLVVPLLRPMGLPLPLIQDSKILYDEIAKLQPGQAVLMSFDWVVEQSIEQMPLARIVLQHVFQRPGVKIACVAFDYPGPIFAEEILSAIDLCGKQYGVDYVNLGFIAGGEGSMPGFARDPVGFKKVDFNGAPLVGMDALAGVTGIADFDLFLITSSGYPGIGGWVRQVQVPYGVRMAMLAVAGGVTTTAPFVQGKQVFALLAGVRGTAEYEKLMGKFSLASASMDAQSMGHVCVFALIVFGNIVGRMRKKQTKAE